MSKWRKALKNKRRFDARYFLSEKVEGQEVIENSVQQEKLKKDFRDFSFDSWLTEDQDLEEAHCTSKRDDKVNEEDSTQTILDLIKQRIKEVGFGKETEEDFDAAKIELVDDYPDKEDEIDRITFDQFVSLNEEESPRYDEPMEELVVPGVMPKGGGEEEATGIKPHIVKILKKREDAAHLGPVPDNLKPEKNEG